MARTDLVAAVLALADGDPALTDNSRLIILGALEGDTALDDALGGHGQTLAQAAAVPASAHPPVGAFLKSIKIAGFRGIGEALTVAFHPGPGLTVIAGRNGSGKSSVAEALEMALTGQSYRWHRQSGAVWTANWRNLHGNIPAEIRVELAEEVDGIGAGALGVMSQGELHALALSLFLPRATAPDSPFRFIVLDDPIQAMDPAKVQGFVQVLQELAVDRQVIVLSHDDRLPTAVRRVKANARIYEVTRMAGSRVTISESSHPAARHLDDGMALALDENVPSAVKDRVIPGLCRMALESAAFEVFQDRFIGQGGDRQEVEERWGATTTLRQRLAIALAADKTADIKKWLAAGRHQEAFNVCNHSVHVGSTRDHGDEVRAVRAAVKNLRASL